MDFPVSYQSLSLSLSLPDLFGNNVTHLLNVFGGMQSGTLNDETGVFYLGEQYSLGSRTVEMVGSGFAQPGISLLGLIVPTGFPVDVLLMRDIDTGQYLFVYPNGTPNILSALALVTNISAQAYSAEFAGAPPVCFCAGTLLATPEGEIPVERILPGDRLLAPDGSERRVAWAGGRFHDALADECRPIVIRPNALGPGLPRRSLRVSPHHRIAVRLGDGGDYLVPAKALLGLRGVNQQKTAERVGYFHILLGVHGLVLAEGLATESLLLGSEAMQTLGPRALDIIALATDSDAAELSRNPAAHPCLPLMTVRETQHALARWALGARHSLGIGAGSGMRRLSLAEAR